VLLLGVVAAGLAFSKIAQASRRTRHFAAEELVRNMGVAELVREAQVVALGADRYRTSLDKADIAEARAAHARLEKTLAALLAQAQEEPAGGLHRLLRGLRERSKEWLGLVGETGDLYWKFKYAASGANSQASMLAAGVGALQKGAGGEPPGGGAAVALAEASLLLSQVQAGCQQFQTGGDAEVFSRQVGLVPRAREFLQAAGRALPEGSSRDMALDLADTVADYRSNLEMLAQSRALALEVDAKRT
jgi:hypothetical protein